MNKMAKEIKNIGDSRMAVAILSEIIRSEEPYISEIAASLGEQSSNIQGYLEAMVSRGWVEKNKSGRRNILEINTKQIFSQHPELTNLAIHSISEEEKITQVMENEDNEAVIEVPGTWEDIDEKIRNYLTNSLESDLACGMRKLSYEEEKNYYSDDILLLESGEETKVVTKNLKELVSDIIQRVMIIESTLSYQGESGLLKNPSELRSVINYLKVIEGNEQETDYPMENNFNEKADLVIPLGKDTHIGVKTQEEN